MVKTSEHISLLITAHMPRKLETRKRYISATPVSLENSRYLPPIYKDITLTGKTRDRDP